MLKCHLQMWSKGISHEIRCCFWNYCIVSWLNVFHLSNKQYEFSITNTKRKYWFSQIPKAVVLCPLVKRRSHHGNGMGTPNLLSGSLSWVRGALRGSEEVIVLSEWERRISCPVHFHKCVEHFAKRREPFLSPKHHRLVVDRSGNTVNRSCYFVPS